MPLRLYAAIVQGEPVKIKSAIKHSGLNWAMDRMNWLEKAAKEASAEFTSIAGKHPSGNPVQKIFLAPEYFFSKERYANDRFFCHDIKRWIIGKLAGLSKTYKDVILIPGTILWSKPAAQQQSKPSADFKSKLSAIVAQQAVVATLSASSYIASKKGTQVNKEGWSHTTSATDAYVTSPLTGGKVLDPKKAKDVALCHNTAYICLNGQVIKYHKTGNYEEVQQEKGKLIFHPGNIKGTFKVGGVRYGIEICMDHAQGVLKDKVDIHLIVSSFVNFKASTAELVLHSSTQLPGVYKTNTGPVKVETEPVRGDWKKVTLLKESDLTTCKVFAFDLSDIAATTEYQLTDSADVKHIYDDKALQEIAKRL